MSSDDRQQGYGTPSGDGPIGGRRNTIQVPRDDLYDPRQYHEQQTRHREQYSQHYEMIRQAMPPETRADVDRGVVERSPDRAMPSHGDPGKRDERD